MIPAVITPSDEPRRAWPAPPEAAAEEAHRVGLFVWGNEIEDFLEPLGVTLEEFCTEFVGSWIFGYARALRTAGLSPVIFCVSRAIRHPQTFQHRPSRAEVRVLPSPWIYRLLRRRMSRPYGRTADAMFGSLKGWRVLMRPALVLIHEISGYLANPVVSLVRELRRTECRVLICQEYEYPRFDLVVLLGGILKLRVFASFQGGDTHSGRLQSFLRPIAVRSADGLIIASRVEATRVSESYRQPADRIHIIPNPAPSEWVSNADQADQRARTRDVLEIPPGCVVVAWHGRVSFPNKGLDLLIEAWSKIRTGAQPVPLRLLLVGSGEHDEQLRRLLDKGGTDDVIWIREFVRDRETVRQYLAASDLYVFPSRHEGFALAPVEAMACGLPVVAAGAPGIADLFEHGEESGGIVVPRESSEALADAALRLIGDPRLRERLGKRALRRIHEELSERTVGERLRSVVLDEAGRR